MREGEPLVAPAIAPVEAKAVGLPRASAVSGALPCKRLSSDTLLAGNNELQIEHGASIYRLRITSLGKLILTK